MRTTNTITTSPDRIALMQSLTHMLLTEYERTRASGTHSEQQMRTIFAMDSLAGVGHAQAVMIDYEENVRPGLIMRRS